MRLYNMKKCVLITGASRGIGHAIALEFAKKKYNIVICSSNSPTELSETAKEIEQLGAGCLSFTLNIGDYDTVTQMFDDIKNRFGGVDILVNNAGISHVGLLQDMTPDEWSHMVNVNLDSVFNTCRNAIPYMLKKQEGYIINISSIWGVCGASCEVAYSATKGGINSFTKALAKELAPINIAVNAIACGVIDTAMNACFSKEDMEELINEIPAGRLGRPEEIARLTVSLTENSKYLTGQIIVMDGGFI